MTATYYVSITSDASKFSQDPDNSGTSSTATDIIELRVGNGTYAPDRAEVLKALDKFWRYYQQGGTDGNGTNIPLPTGPN
jgi:hypothetical protein